VFERRASALHLATLVVTLLAKGREQHDQARLPVGIPERHTPRDALALEPKLEEPSAERPRQRHPHSVTGTTHALDRCFGLIELGRSKVVQP
jgi:hypothetical protein